MSLIIDDVPYASYVYWSYKFTFVWNAYSCFAQFSVFFFFNTFTLPFSLSFLSTAPFSFSLSLPHMHTHTDTHVWIWILIFTILTPGSDFQMWIVPAYSLFPCRWGCHKNEFPVAEIVAPCVSQGDQQGQRPSHRTPGKSQRLLECGLSMWGPQGIMAHSSWEL